ncbi:MAG: hypothetical protein KJ737_26410 [Proteobacteria bacterium]|nr:hypothetical protein [Pseudomonadota bacterium]
MKKYVFIITIILISCSVSMAVDNDIHIHGFISQGFLQTDHNQFIQNSENGTFQFNEMGLNFNTQITDDLHLGIQFFASDFGDIGNDKITVNFARASYYYRQWLSFHAGINKVAFGLHGDTRDLDMIRPTIFLPSGVYPESFRDCLNSAKGLEFRGNWRPTMPEFQDILGEFNYTIQCGIMDINKESGVGRVLAKAFHTDSEYSESDTAINMIFNWEPPVPGLRLIGQYAKFGYNLGGKTINDIFWQSRKEDALSDMAPTINPESISVTNIPVDYDGYIEEILFGFEYSWQDLVFSFEHVKHIHDFDITVDVLFLPDTTLPITVPFENNSVGFYYMFSYRHTDWLKFGAYYSVFYPNEEDKKGNGLGTNAGRPDYFAWQKDSCLSFRFDFNRNCSLKLEGHYLDGCAQLDDTVKIEPDEYFETNRYWYLFAAKISYNF